MFRVVILGQDPYPQIKSDGYPRAQGLSFSIIKDDNVGSVASLRNIFAELRNNYPGIVLNSGDLTPWALQGVLLLNMSLTAQADNPNAYSGKHKIWLPFIKRIFDAIEEANHNVIYVLWGKEAQ